MASTIIQRYIKQVLEAFYHPQSQVRMTVINVVVLILRQGLVHPVQVGSPYPRTGTPLVPTPRTGRQLLPPRTGTPLVPTPRTGKLCSVQIGYVPYRGATPHTGRPLTATPRTGTLCPVQIGYVQYRGATPRTGRQPLPPPYRYAPSPYTSYRYAMLRTDRLCPIQGCYTPYR